MQLLCRAIRLKTRMRRIEAGRADVSTSGLKLGGSRLGIVETLCTDANTPTTGYLATFVVGEVDELNIAGTKWGEAQDFFPPPSGVICEAPSGVRCVVCGCGTEWSGARDQARRITTVCDLSHTPRFPACPGDFI